MSILSCGRIYIDIQGSSEFAFFSTNKSDKKDKLSHQSLNITSSSNVIVKILNIVSHNHTFRHAGSYKWRIALTFVKPRGREGQNGRLKCPMGFLAYLVISLIIICPFCLYLSVVLFLGEVLDLKFIEHCAFVKKYILALVCSNSSPDV